MPSFFGTFSSETYRFLRPAAVGKTGTIALSLRLNTTFYSDSSSNSKPVPSGMTVVYTVDGKAVTGEIGWPYIVSFDSSTCLDGYHSLAIILVDARVGVLSGNPAQYRVLPRLFKTSNGQRKSDRVPTHGFPNRITNQFSVTADWLPVPTKRPLQPPLPTPYVFAPPASKSSDPAKYKRSNAWILEPLCQVTSELYQSTPSWYLDADGDAYISDYYPQTQPELEQSMDRLWKIPFYDGPRNNNSISPYCTIAYDWNSPDMYGVDLIGRFFRIGPDGTVTTLFGPRGDPTVIPVKHDEGFYGQRIGMVTDGSSPDLMCAIDISQHRTKPHIWYIADMDRQRICELDLSESVARMSTYVTGINWSASFYVCPDNSMVVAEMGGTHDGHTMPPGIAVISPDKVIRRLDYSGTTITVPFCVRPTSDWQLICADRTNKSVYEFNPTTGASKLIANATNLGPVAKTQGDQWTWIAVDRVGAVGPVDDIVLVQYTGPGNVGNWRVPRVNTITTRVDAFWKGSGGYCRVGPAEFVHDAMGHYPWVLAISEREARVAFYGGGGDGLLSFRGRVAADPPASFDLPTFNAGRSIFIRGTITGFPHGIRPTFTALLNQNGNGRTGTPTFDEIAAWPDVTLRQWIQGGMGGAVPRPEIVGYPLACLMYYIRKNSTRNLLQSIPVPKKPLDIVAPVITDVVASGSVITWKTNEPTLGYVAFGSSVAYHRWSEAESRFGTQHQIRLEHLPVACWYSVRCTDQAGNVVFGPDIKLR